MRRSDILLIFLTAYHPSRWHRRQVLLEQCLKDSPLDYKFVFGDEPFSGDRERCGIRDEDFLYAPGSDAKKFMHLKNQAAFKFALDQGYSHVLRCCCDTWVYPDRILKAGLENYDLAANFPLNFKLGGVLSVPWLRMSRPHGGCGIWLSRKAMEMLVADEWNEHYLDSWPEKIDVGFGIEYSLPDRWLWDDFWISEVLQGNLAYNDPLRNQPWAAYTAQGINVYSDDMLFENSEPMRPLCIHDPGIHKPNDESIKEVVEQARQRNIATNARGRLLHEDGAQLKREPTNAF